jgi:predicted NBD/HSP70 family sugar kinase/predicted transcriptional regulator
MMNQKTSNIEVKKLNKSLIYDYIYNNGQLSKQDIAYSLNMSLPTVTQNLRELLEQGLILEDGQFESTGGRKAKAISYNSNARFAIGLDITKNHTGIVMINLGGNVIKHVRIRNQFENTEAYFKNLGDIINRFVDETKVDADKICGVSIAVPAILSDDKQTVVYSPVLGFTGGTCEKFSQYIPYECSLCNDANAAGFAELWNSNDIQNVVYLSLSDSVGGSILIDNNLYFGENQRSGEFGHMTIVPNGRNCYCGQKGCVDAYCSARVLSESTNGNISEFFDLLKKGSEPHKTIWQEYLYYLGLTINNLRMLFDCNVIIGGYVGSYIDDYIDSTRKMIAQRNTFETDGTYLKACNYKLEAIAVGAALMKIKQVIDSI